MRTRVPLLFSYGSLQEADVQLATFGRLLTGQRDALVGYGPSLVLINDPEVAATLGRTHHANVTHNGRNDSCVSGTRFEVTDTELARADAFEAAFDYVRVSTVLASGNDAWVYVARS